MKDRWQRVVVALLLLSVAVAFALATPGLSPVAAIVPLFVLVPTIGLLTVQLVLDLLPTGESGARRGTELRVALPVVTKEGRSFLLLAASLAGILLAGLVVGGAVVALFWLRVSGERWTVSMVVAALLGGLLYLAFEVLLGITLFPGVLR